MNQPPKSTEETSSAEIPVLLTVADIIRFKAEYEADVRLYEELPARIKQKKRRYEAALFFAPPGFDPNAPVPAPVVAPVPAPLPTPSPEPSAPAACFELVSQPMIEEDADESEGEGRLTWIGELLRVLEAASRGLPHQEVLAMLKQTKLGERVSAGEKGFYNAVARLEKRGQLIKNGGLLYSPKLVEQMRQRGEVLPDVSLEMRRRAGGSGTVVLEVLSEHPEGLDVQALRNEVIKKPGVPASLEKHTHYIYNVVATLIGQGAVTKDAQGRYRIKGES